MSDRGRRVMLVRHPETEANVAGRYIGRSDSPLSERGLRQRSWLAGEVVGFAATGAFSSPLGRALETARAIAPEGVAVQVLDGLSEIDFGQAEGLTYDEIAARGIRLDYTGGGPIAPEGESGEEFDARVRRMAEEVLGAGSRSLVVTHGGVMRRLLVVLLGLPAGAGWSFAVPNAAVAVVRVHGETGILERLTAPLDLGEDRA